MHAVCFKEETPLGIRINNNLTALGARRNLANAQTTLERTLERLSSGLRINRAADDAAGLAVSEKLRTQIRGHQQAISNAQDGIQLIHTAEGGLEQISGILQRMRELSIQSANDSYTQDDRAKIETEIEQLRTELSRIAHTTEYNTRSLLDGSIQSAQRDMRSTQVEISQNVRIGNPDFVPPDIRDLIGGIQAVASDITLDQAISLKIVNTGVTTDRIGMEVRSSIWGLLTLIPDVSQLYSSSLGISLDSLGPSAGLLTLDVNGLGGYVSGPVDRATPLYDLALVGRLGKVSTGNMTLTVEGTTYSLNVDPNSDTIDSVIAKIAALSNGTHTFSAAYNDTTNRFSISVSRTSPVINTYVATNGYTSTPPAAYGPSLSPPGAPFPSLNLAAPGFEYPPGGGQSFPNLDTLGENTTVTASGNLATALGGITTQAGQNRLITSYSDTFSGSVANGASHDNFDLTTTADFSQVTSQSVVASATGGLTTAADWSSQGVNFAAGNLSVQVQDINGVTQTVNVAVQDTDNVGATLANLQAAVNGVAGGGESYTVGLNGGGQLQITHVISKNFAGTAQVSQTTSGYVPPDAPIPFGGSSGPNNFSGALAPAALFPNPGGFGAEIDLSIAFGGSTNLASVLFLGNVGDNSDLRTSTYDGNITAQAAHHAYNLTTTQTETQLSQTNSVQSAQQVGSPYAISQADLGKVAVIQILAAVKSPIPDRALTLQVGANEGQFLKLGVDEVTARALRIETLSVLGTSDEDSRLKSQNAIGLIGDALDHVNLVRARLGALQNRLEYTIENLQVSRENLAASESRIRDADIAEETARLTRSQILVQAGTSVLSQANLSPQSALSLLGR